MAKYLLETAATGIMPSLADRCRLKDKIIDNIAKAIKHIQVYRCREPVEVSEFDSALSNNSTDTCVLSNSDWQFQKLAEALDHALLHGLKSVTKGYWVVVQEFTHESMKKEILKLTLVTTNLGRGRAWLYLALMENLLECFMNSFIDNSKLIMRFYCRDALALDKERLSQLLTLTSGLSFITFQLDVNVGYLDLYSYDRSAVRYHSGSTSLEDDDERVGGRGGGVREMREEDDNISIYSMNSISSEQSFAEEACQRDLLMSSSQSSLSSFMRPFSSLFDSSSACQSSSSNSAHLNRSSSYWSSDSDRVNRFNSVDNSSTADVTAAASCGESAAEPCDEAIEVIRMKPKRLRSKNSVQKNSIKRSSSEDSSIYSQDVTGSRCNSTTPESGYRSTVETSDLQTTSKDLPATSKDTASKLSTSIFGEVMKFKDLLIGDKRNVNNNQATSSGVEDLKDNESSDLEKTLKESVDLHKVVSDANNITTKDKYSTSDLSRSYRDSIMSDYNISSNNCDIQVSAEDSERLFRDLGIFSSDKSFTAKDTFCDKTSKGHAAVYSDNRFSSSPAKNSSTKFHSLPCTVENSSNRIPPHVHSEGLSVKNSSPNKDKTTVNINSNNEFRDASKVTDSIVGSSEIISQCNSVSNTNNSNPFGTPSNSDEDLYNGSVNQSAADVALGTMPSLELTLVSDNISIGFSPAEGEFGTMPDLVVTDSERDTMPSLETNVYENCQSPAASGIGTVPGSPAVCDSSDNKISEEGLTGSYEGPSLYDDVPKYVASMKRNNSMRYSESRDSISSILIEAQRVSLDDNSSNQDASSSCDNVGTRSSDTGNNEDDFDLVCDSDKTSPNKSNSYRHRAEQIVDNNTLLEIMADVFKCDEEKLHKLYSTVVGHTEGEPHSVQLMLTTQALYLISSGPPGKQKFIDNCFIHYSHLDYISVGIDGQTLNIVCKDRRKQLWITTGDQLLTKCIIEELKVAIGLSILEMSLPEVVHEATTQVIATKKLAASETSMSMLEVELKRCSLVHWEDREAFSSPDLRLPLHKEGYLYYKPPDMLHHAFSGMVWSESILARPTYEPYYFVLRKTETQKSLYKQKALIEAIRSVVHRKDGVLSMYDNKTARKSALMSITVSATNCTGCRANPNSRQPNSFELKLSDKSRIKLAGETKESAVDWMHTLCLTMSEGEQSHRMSSVCVAACLALTQAAIIMYHEELQSNFLRALDVADLSRLTAAELDDDDEESNAYCILVFCETLGAKSSAYRWALYFYSREEREQFLTQLKLAYQALMQVELDVLPLENTLIKRCRRASSKLRSATSPIITSAI